MPIPRVGTHDVLILPVCIDIWAGNDNQRDKKGRKINMAKSKLVKANRKVTEKVVGTFGKIEDTVVGSYTKIEDAFVARYLTKDGETVEEAKKRLQQKQL